MLALSMVVALCAQEGFVEQYTRTYGFRLGAPRGLTVTPDGDAVLFVRANGPRSFVQDLWSFDVATGKEKLLLTAGGVLKGASDQLSRGEKAQREREREAAGGITRFRLSKDGKTLLVPLGGRLYAVERASGKVRVVDSKAGRPINPTFSPDGKHVAAVRGRDVYVTNLATGKETRLTFAKGETVSHGLPEFAAAEEMGRGAGYWWSPDSKRIAYTRVDEAPVEELWRMDATKPEKPAIAARFPRAGTPNADVRLFVVTVDGKQRHEVKWDRAKFPYLARVMWPKSGPLTFVLQDRAQQELRIVATHEGKTKVLHTEKDAAWINLDGRFPIWRKDGFLWSHERDGGWQVDHHAPNGKVTRTVVPKTLGYRSFVHVDANATFVVASAEPTEAHLYRVPNRLAPPAKMTTEKGRHRAVFGKKGNVYVHLFAGPDGTRWAKVKKRDGTVLGQLEDLSEPLPFRPQLELTTVEASNERFHAAIIRPHDFDAKRRYPVLVHVYGGPTAQMVTASGRRYLRDQWYANHGYVVIAVDGRGTPGRGRAWERSTYRDVIAKPLDDQVAVLQALGKRHPELDLSRVGIYGWSFGGYFSAMAVLRRPDVFHAGVAGAPVTDWRDYDTHYTERYMGHPKDNVKGYDDTSAVKWAAKLTRPLLIIHGTNDDNVYFTHSLKLSDALFRAGKHHDLLALPGFTHMVPDPDYARSLQGRILGHFERHLKEAKAR